MEPGCKLDELVILIGPQGSGKSTAVKNLLPAELQWGFSDALILSNFNKERIESTLGKIVVEVSELVGSKRADIDSLKAYLSRTDDFTRLAYDRRPVRRLRNFILIGTANDSEPLPNDPSGNRRFVPIEIAGGNVAAGSKWLDANRLRLWAEAIALYKRGIEAWLPNTLKRQQAATAEKARFRDDVIENFLEKDIMPALRAGDGLTLEEIIRRADWQTYHPRDLGLQRRFGSALKQAGAVKVRVTQEGAREMRWFLA